MKKIFIPKGKPEDIIFCNCGCGERIPYLKIYKYKGYPKYINSHSNNLRKGKTNIELFGIEKAKIMNKKPKGFGEKVRQNQLGKTFEERFGNKKSKEIKEKMHIWASHTYEEKYGKNISNILKEKAKQRIIEVNKILQPKRKQIFLENKEKLLNRICICGCNQKLNSIEKRTKFIPGHQNRNINFKIKAYFNEIKLCACGCGNKIIYKNKYKYTGWPKYLHQHHMNISKEKLYGSIEKCKEINRKISASSIGIKKPEGFGENIAKNQLGKSFEQRFGNETAKKAKIKIITSSSRNYVNRLGVDEAKRQCEMRVKARQGKTYVELFGHKKALEICKKKQESMPDWGKGKNEEVILNFMEKILNKKIDRTFWVKDEISNERYKLDGYVESDNLCIEVDENYHHTERQKSKDQERECKLKKLLNCKILRINELNFLKQFGSVLYIS